MRFKDQAILLNMHIRDGLYEKTIDGYRVQFISKKDKQGFHKKPCIIFMVNRGISLLEQQRIFNSVFYKKMILKIVSLDVKNDTICIQSPINNRNIDIVMSEMFNIIHKLIELQLFPPDEKTYNKYKFSFGDEHQVDRIFADI